MIACAMLTASAAIGPRHACGRDRQIEDVILVRVLDRTVVRERAIKPARRHHGQLVR